VQVVNYTSSGCAELYALQEVDIEGDAELYARYQFEIPVLCINGVEARVLLL
jgi:hypothetical protein